MTSLKNIDIPIIASDPKIIDKNRFIGSFYAETFPIQSYSISDLDHQSVKSDSVMKQLFRVLFRMKSDASIRTEYL